MIDVRICEALKGEELLERYVERDLTNDLVYRPREAAMGGRELRDVV